MTCESFIDAAAAGEFLSLPSKRVMRMARAGQLPGYPVGDSEKRRQWRFLKSELANFMRSRSNSASRPHPGSE
jgi:hypothetical protein